MENKRTHIAETLEGTLKPWTLDHQAGGLVKPQRLEKHQRVSAITWQGAENQKIKSLASD